MNFNLDTASLSGQMLKEPQRSLFHPLPPGRAPLIGDFKNVQGQLCVPTVLGIPLPQPFTSLPNKPLHL